MYEEETIEFCEKLVEELTRLCDSNAAYAGRLGKAMNRLKKIKENKLTE